MRSVLCGKEVRRDAYRLAGYRGEWDARGERSSEARARRMQPRVLTAALLEQLDPLLQLDGLVRSEAADVGASAFGVRAIDGAQRVLFASKHRVGRLAESAVRTYAEFTRDSSRARAHGAVWDECITACKRVGCVGTHIIYIYNIYI